jgi:hypothetical protein
MAHHDSLIEIAAALFVMAVAVWFVGPTLVVVLALVIYLPALLIWWGRRWRHR